MAMEPETMDTNAPAPTATSPLRGQVIVAVSLGVLLFAGTVVMLRSELQGAMAMQSARQQEATDRLAKKVAALESQLDGQTTAIAAIPHADTAALDAARADLASAQGTIAQLNERLTVLEKKPVESAVVPPSASALGLAVRSGAPYALALSAWEKNHGDAASKIAALRASASSGIATEAMLRNQLLVALDQRLSAPVAVDEPGIVSRINAHFGGLVTIKKQSALADAGTLRAAASTETMESLTHRVTALPVADQAPFAAWLAAVRAHDAALSELAGIEATP